MSWPDQRHQLGAGLLPLLHLLNPLKSQVSSRQTPPHLSGPHTNGTSSMGLPTPTAPSGFTVRTLHTLCLSAHLLPMLSLLTNFKNEVLEGEVAQHPAPHICEK